MLHWAYCNNLQSDEITISDAEAHHLIHVLRSRVGNQVTLFDGCGTVTTAEVCSLTRRDVVCRVLSKIHQPRPPRPEFTVVAAPPKADRLKLMVEKLTEIGVDRLILLESSRTVTVPGETRLDKIHSNMIAACKQSRRPYFMELQPLQPLKAVLAGFHPLTDGPTVYIAHPEALTRSNPTDFFDHAENSSAVIIGPEGGFTEDEFEMATSCGAIPVSWPDTILRIETAAVVFAALLMSRTFESSK